eukprot:8764903-Alexandrium_andersonii.AAC.1
MKALFGRWTEGGGGGKSAAVSAGSTAASRAASSAEGRRSCGGLKFHQRPALRPAGVGWHEAQCELVPGATH